MRVQRLLIYRLGSLGDTVIALPCFHLIRHAFPSAHITILTNRPVAAKAAPLISVLGPTGLFDEVIDYPVALRHLGELQKLRHRLRAGNFDLAIHLTASRGFLNSGRDYLFFRACGIPRVIGLPWRRDDLEVVRTADGLYENESIRLARRVRSLGKVDLAQPQSWDFALTLEEKGEAQRLLAANGIASPFLGISLGTKLRVKDWTAANWQALLAKLAESHPRLAIVALGAEEERADVDSTLAVWRGATANLCGKTSPRVSAAILEKAVLFVGHDSGPMHLAAVVGTPCVALFAGQAPRGQWFPRGEKNTILVAEKLCPDCTRGDCRQINGVCLLSISVAEVFAAVQQQLQSAT